MTETNKPDDEKRWNPGDPGEKKHINLSEHAVMTLIRDFEVFYRGERKGATVMVNEIFECYREHAKASIALRIKETEEKYKEIFSQYPNNDEIKDVLEGLVNEFHLIAAAKIKKVTIGGKDVKIGEFLEKASEISKEQIIAILVEKEKSILIENVKELLKIKGNQMKYSLRINSRDYLLQGNGADEKNYYTKKMNSSLTGYIKAVVEEYCKLPPVEREYYFFGESISKIQSYIDANYLIQITLRDTSKYLVKPHKILKDVFNSYNYLVGMQKAGDKWQPATYRISNIIAANKVTGSGKIPKDETEKLKKRIMERGVQYLLSDVKRVEVHLTPAGKKDYARILHQRPEYNREESDIQAGNYVFYCTLKQAENYFIRLGANALVTSPESLVKILTKKYQAAYELYTQTEQT